ncbi:GumC family protein [Roseibacillus ishigakijimensis]|uniref:non-specific protein-tyrosine kinase n=1 Tax=Roseibacillus ishigakijimensis TaxID=454146 RepID=A0A934VGK5_9BACT|nr:polysaccharide biosynthesis tyrosine autokinase [Roseibacillus ishigakijimensis]MBK1832968.1 polysaccharide biosynthesis tyrosine autokinase [Roseibacillus ishigakijimensis]
MSHPSENTNEASLHAVDYWQVLRNRYGIILLTFILVFLTAAVITRVMPKQYASTSVVQVNPEVQGFGSDLGALQSRQFFQTQFEVITAARTLKVVSDNLDLENKWGLSENAVIGELKKMVETTQRTGTDLIEIRVKHIEPEVAAEVAAEVAFAYQKRRKDEETARAEDQLKALNDEIEDQMDKVQAKRMKLDSIVQITKRPYFEGAQNSPEGMEMAIARMADQQAFEMKKNRDQYKIYLDRLEKLDSEQVLRYAAELPVENNTVRGLHTEYLAVKRELDAMKASGLGERHPDLQVQKERLQGLRADLDTAVGALRESLATNFEMISEQLRVMEDISTEKESDLVDLATEMHQYREAQRDYESALELLQELKLTHSAERVALRSPKEPITIQEEPKVNENPVSPKVTLNLVLGAVVGLIFGIAIAFFLEYVDTSVKTLEDVERFLQMPVLAVVPKDVGVLHKQSGMSPDAEAYRILRTNIEFNRKNPEDNAITVVSGGAGEGKSTTLVNLAYVCAQGGYTTLMIDADLRRPRLHTFFDINNSVGLTNYLTTDLMLEDVILQTPVDNLYFMPSGVLPADAAGILNSRRMSELIQDVKQRFDLVLVDSPPILGVSDASVLASEVDLTMIVVQHRKLPRNMLLRVKQAVENVGGHVIGVVLNNVDIRSDNQYQYYTSYYTYYAPSAEPESRSTRPVVSKDKKVTTTKPVTDDSDLY